MTTKCDVAVIGAGPYGLCAAAHLQSIKGLDVRVFGEPMSFWQRHMPAGMKLRSPYSGSHFSDPRRQFTLEAYQHATEILSPMEFLSSASWITACGFNRAWFRMLTAAR